MSELKETGELKGLSLAQHLMSDWRSILDIEYKRWKEQDEQAYHEIIKALEELEMLRSEALKKT